MLVATAGHVDHGKTALIKALTNIETDRLAEEKKRGLSIELGFAYHALGSAGTIGFIDVPGHEKFLPNMLSGVAGIDVAILVIAADDGPMVQTLEHLSILQLLNIQAGLVVISKADKVDGNRLRQVRAEIDELVKNTFLCHCPVFVVSSHNKSGVDRLAAHLDKFAAALPEPDHHQQKFRLAIDRWFIKDGHGLIVTGTVYSGSVSVGDRLMLSSSGSSLHDSSTAKSAGVVTHSPNSATTNTIIRIKGIHANNLESATAIAGQRCAINIGGRDIQASALKRGDWLLSSSASPSSYRIDARLTILPSEQNPIKHWTPIHIYIGAAHTIGRLAMLPTENSIEPGRNGLVRLVTNTPVYSVAGDHFVIRDQADQRTIGGGTTIDPYGPSKGHAKTQRLRQLQLMEIPDRRKSLECLLAEAPNGLKLRPLTEAWNLSTAEGERIVKSVNATLLPEVAFDSIQWQALTTKICDFLTFWSTKNIGHQGIYPEYLWGQLALSMELTTLIDAINRLIGEGLLARTGHLIHPLDHEVQASEAEQAFWHFVRPLLEESGPCPPVVHDLALRLDMDDETLRDNLQRMTQLGRLVKVGSNRYFSVTSLNNLQQLVFRLARNSESDSFSAAQFRDESGIGRRPSIDILEFFDASGITRRQHDVRVLINRSVSMFS